MMVAEKQSRKTSKKIKTFFFKDYYLKKKLILRQIYRLYQLALGGARNSNLEERNANKSRGEITISREEKCEAANLHLGRSGRACHSRTFISSQARNANGLQAPPKQSSYSVDPV